MKENTLCLLFILFCLGLLGCVMPVYVPSYSGSRLIDLSEIKPGVTTKEDIFLKFGDIFSVHQNEKVLTYSYSVKKGYFGWLVGIPGGTGRMIKDDWIVTNYEVEIEFDDNDVAKRCEEFKLPR